MCIRTEVGIFCPKLCRMTYPGGQVEGFYPPPGALAKKEDGQRWLWPTLIHLWPLQSPENGFDFLK